MFDHYPEWGRELAQKYLSRTINQFIVHGNIHDLVPLQKDAGTNFLRLKSFFTEEFFGARDFVIFYDRSSGISFRDKESQKDFNRALSGRDSLLGTDYADNLPKDPVRVFSLLEQYFRLRFDKKKSVAFIVDYAETVVPMSQAGATGAEDRTAMVYLSRWAQDPMFLAADFTTILLTENLANLNNKLVQHPYIHDIKISIPEQPQRKDFIEHEVSEEVFDDLSDLSTEVVAQQTAGLNFINIREILSNAKQQQNSISLNRLSEAKKELIEAEAYGLLEFVESDYTLDNVAGHQEVKKHLRKTKNAFKNGRQDVLPMGYLVCGPVGTGKTFMVTCFAGEVGIPMVKLKNFRSQWQGVTEGNLEKILDLLKAMAPVAVMIDEADAYLGDRDAGGDSGVSSRVFSQISSFMSDTSNRGEILWFLMTARPDLMPVDLKRQGRAEEHLALFHPQTKEDKIELFNTLKQKAGLQLPTDEVPVNIKSGEPSLSGADMEAALTRAKFRAAAQNMEHPTLDIVEKAFNDFLPPTYTQEIELQTLAAVVECTSKELLPEHYRDKDRGMILDRMEELKYHIG